MILSALLIALTCTFSGALAGLAPGDDGDCALFLSGPGRSSAYDYTINLLKGNFGYEGQHTCITYEAVNQAYLEARNRILVSQPKGDWKPEDFASVGELVLDISINLARRYGLSYEEVEKGLPLIDTSRTLIREVCPPVFSHVECRAGKYRRLDGLCNNLQHPTWGATNSPFQRLISPLFADGINSPRISHSGRDLPLSRVVSRTMHPDDGFHDHAGTVMVIAWGQFMDHDYTLTGTPLDPINRNDPEECCKRPPQHKHPYCNEIRIPDDDYFYRLFGVKCIDFVRAFPSPRPGCRLGSRVAFNTLTGAIDGNTVYGVTEKFARKLRTGFGGLLRMNPVFKEYGLKDLLPLKLDIPDEGCTRPNKNMYCFEAGEIRVNEQLILTVMHTLMAREHNRVANALAEVNPHWDDETLYQEARRINIAEIQHITYNEFLPILLGKDVMEKFGLVLEKKGYWEGYDPEVNPDVLAAFAAAAYRFGHSLLPTAVERWSKAHKFIASKRLSDLIRRPYDLYRAGVLDEYVMGLMNQVAQAMDDSITQEVTNHLFKKVGARFGMDLVSFNMQRGREFGLPGYMEFRKFCGLPGAETFQDLFGTMTNHTVRKYETIFEHPIDVDLWSGGVSERPLPGSMLGPTFACIIATQFSYSRRGDRFWFELPNQPSSFTQEQLAEIRKSRLARIICDNTDIIDTVQLYPMVLPDHELNPRVPCRSGIIPMMDFSKWAEPAPFHGPAKQYVTNASITSYNGTISETAMDTEDNNYNNTNDNEEVIKNINLLILSHLNDTETEAITTDMDDEELNLNGTIQNIENTNTKFVSPELVEQNNNGSNSADRINLTQSKAVPKSNVVLKYVYKNDGEGNDALKTKGHDENSLTRRKRSYSNSQEQPDTAQNAPEIVNYETSHSRNIGEPPQLRSANIIRNSDLADFSIQTLHQGARNKKPIQDLKPIKYIDGPSHTNINGRYDNNDSEELRKAYSDYRSNEKYDKDNSNEDRKQYKDDESNDKYKNNYSKEDKNQYRDSNSHEKHDSNNAQEDKQRYTNNDRDKYNSDYSKEDSNQYKDNDSREKHDSHNSQNDKKLYRDNDSDKYNSNYSKENKNQYKDNDSREKYDSHRSQKDKQQYRENHNSEKYDTDNSKDDKRLYRDSAVNDRYSNKDSVEDGKLYRERLSDNNASVEDRKPYTESNEKYGDSNKKKTYRDSAESSDSQEYKQSKPDNFRGNGQYIQKSDSKPYDISNESYETEEQGSSHLPSRTNSRESEDSNERSYESSTKSALIKNPNTSLEATIPYYSNDKESTHENKHPDHLKSSLHNLEPRKSFPNSNENSNESSEDVLRPKNIYHADYKNERSNNSLRKIQDVDLDDFSYERIQVNNKGEVEPAKDVQENTGIKFTADTLNITTPKPTIKLENYNDLHSTSKETRSSPSNLEAVDNSAEPIRINDGEVKPVVELNIDNDSTELTEENKNSGLKTNEQDQSLETLLGVKEPESNEHNDNIEAQKITENNGDVKQQFERIPLNYKHSESAEKQNSVDVKSKGFEIDAPIGDVPENNVPETQNDGTLDALTPPEQYDEHLNIKFDDLVINLPEIKLPDDILAYTRDDSPYVYGPRKDDDDRKQNYYHYRDDQDDEQDGQKKKSKIKEKVNKDEDDRGYYGYYDDYQDKQKYQKKEEDDDEEEEKEEEAEEGEDLYEKFVRERFGKRGSFEKRSENLQDTTRAAPKNPELYKTIQNILKKTEDVEKQAVASGDPKAGYMWTLEYGENAK